MLRSWLGARAEKCALRVATYADTNKAVPLVAGAEAVFHIMPNGAAFNPKDFYSYTLQPADDLKTSVPQGAGAGKI